MEPEKKAKAMLYTRLCCPLPTERAVVDGEKFGRLYDMLGPHRGEAEVLFVACPEVLGDTYEELVVNLDAVAEAGLALRILPPGERSTGHRMTKIVCVLCEEGVGHDEHVFPWAGGIIKRPKKGTEDGPGD